jgi:hypothetical protein
MNRVSWTKEARAKRDSLTGDERDLFIGQMRSGQRRYGHCGRCGKDAPICGTAWDWDVCYDCMNDLNDCIQPKRRLA